MDKFWEWMLDKGHAQKHGGMYFMYDTLYTGLPKQMLIGYKYQYCFDNGIEIHFSFSGIDQLDRKLTEAIESGQ